MAIGIIIYFLIAAFVFVRVIKKDRIFSIFLLFTYIYSIVPLINLIYYPELVRRQNYSPTRETTPYLYLVYITITLVFLYIAHSIVIGKYYSHIMERKGEKVRIGKISLSGGTWNMQQFGFMCVIAYILFLAIYLFTNFGMLSYRNQGSFMFQFLASLFGIIAYVLFFNERGHAASRILKIFAVVIVALSLLYAFWAGERGAVLIYFIGLGYVFLEKNFKKIREIKPGTIMALLLMFFALIYVSQIVRVSRGFAGRIILNPKIIIEFFRPKAFLFQDYAVPGYELMYCIDHNVVRPDWVFGSFIGNGIFIFDYPSLGLQIPLPGFANFNYIEGYMLAGWIGAVIYPFILCLWFRFYYMVFMNSGSRNYKLFMGFMMASFFTIHLVRGGETFMFLKFIYMYFIPGSILYQMINGRGQTRMPFVEREESCH